MNFYKGYQNTANEEANQCMKRAWKQEMNLKKKWRMKINRNSIMKFTRQWKSLSKGNGKIPLP